MPPPFKTTSELLAYVQENPQTLRDKWWEYYVADKAGSVARAVITQHGDNPVFLQTEDGISAWTFDELLCFTPIPCPHFIFRYTTNWLPLLDGLKLLPKEYLAACNIAAAQPKHSLTLCIQDAWKVDDVEFCNKLGDWLGEDVYECMVATGYQLSISKNLLHNYIEILINNVFTPAIAHQKEVFLAGHRERGLLNKKLFNT